MDIDPRTYPSRTFVRFTAHNQLMADATGMPITASIQRLGGNTYTQQVLPEGESPSSLNDPNGTESGFSMGLSMNPISDKNTTDSGAEMVGSAEPTSEDEASVCGVDEALFEEIIKTTLNPNRFPELYQCCGTQKAAAEVETRVAAEVVAAYRQINRKQNCPIVQRLNSLL